MAHPERFEDFQDLLQYANKDIIEKTSVCPKCGEEIHIFIELDRVSVLCKHCGYCQSEILGKQ